ncbi:hypothetical protein [Halogeometricum sp. CBA1124]|nr:hypothetical protein [Halogeometricum sp. CBA1124]
MVEEFAGPTPPVLALQWGIADGVSVGETRCGTGRRTCSACAQ